MYCEPISAPEFAKGLSAGCAVDIELHVRQQSTGSVRALAYACTPLAGGVTYGLSTRAWQEQYSAT